jgi:hypothetical protein
VVRRIVWPITALVGLVILAVGISTVPAQPGVPMYGMAGQVGRFVVAHASEKQVIILDTTTGKLYRATDSDFKKASELPKVGMPNMGPRGGRPQDFEKKIKEFEEKKRKEFEKLGDTDKGPLKDTKPPKDKEGK